MTPKSLRAKISKLSVKAPVAESYTRALIAREIFSGKPVWYRTQKEHWMGWLSQYDGPGAYNRKTWKGRSAEFVYNHVNNPAMLLWLAEAAGVPRKDLLAAKRAALSDGRTRGTHCAILRKSIPWATIEDRL